MTKWRCTVCGYVHKGEAPPDSCPVCGADRSRFIPVEAEEEAVASTASSEQAPPSSPAPQKWQCTVCGYDHAGATPPDSCPVCGSEARLFNVIPGEQSPAAQPLTELNSEDDSAHQRWQCTVCGYIHTGSAPPPNCPVCGTEQSKFLLLDTTEDASDKQTAPAKVEGPVANNESEADPVADPQPPASFWAPYRRWIDLAIDYHAHPIAVHIPNGVLPITVFMVLLAGLFDWPAIGHAGVYNMGFIFLSMPIVLFTGYLHWQFKFGGNMTDLFKWKMICGAGVFALALILFAWGVVSPETARHPGGVYLLLHIIMLAVAGVAGWLGGKLVFRPKV